MDDPRFEIFYNAFTQKLYVSVDSLDYILAKKIVEDCSDYHKSEIRNALSLELKRLRYKLNREVEEFLTNERKQFDTMKTHLIEKMREAEDGSE